MTIRELIDELECFDGNEEVVMKPYNSMYVDGIRYVDTKELRSFYGKDRNVVVLMSDGQEGAV